MALESIASQISQSQDELYRDVAGASPLQLENPETRALHAKLKKIRLAREIKKMMSKDPQFADINRYISIGEGENYV